MLMERRSFLVGGVILAPAVVGGGFLGFRVFGESRRAYALAPESMLPADIQRARVEVREAYRFAIANREILRSIPCYCGCGAEGHTSNASCYLKDFSTPGNLVFDRMSLN
jgi:hypothetical protein